MNMSQRYTLQNRRNRDFDKRFNAHQRIVIGFSVIVALLVAAGIGFSFFSASQTNTATACVVTDKNRTTTPEGESSHRIYTENCGTFSADDSLLDFKFNSADIYGSIKVGGTYNFDTRGVRLPIFSSFPNIINATATQR